MNGGGSKDAVEDVFFAHLNTGEGFDSDVRMRVDTPGMCGALAVKDLNGNQHHLVTRTSLPTCKGGEHGDHAEPRLLREAGKHFQRLGKQLSAAKVVISMEASPCRSCTPNLLEWCQECVDRIAPANRNSVYFVFNFHHIYQRSNGGYASDRWSSPDAAWQEYRQQMKTCPLTDPITTKSGMRRYQLLNFRQFSANGGLRYLDRYL
jgi:hypothetical protein